MSSATSSLSSPATTPHAVWAPNCALAWTWREQQADFANALLDLSRPISSALRGPGGEPSLRRFNVYRNNIFAGLTRVLQEGFPVVNRLVGDQFFAFLARSFIMTAPPHSPLLYDYGAELADFIASFEPAVSVPYLADVARLERACLEAHYAEEANVLGVAHFSKIPTADQPRLRFRLHPSLRVVGSRFPVLSIWRANIELGPCPVDLSIGTEDALIVRPEANVMCQALAPGGAAFVNALAAGLSVLEATEAALGREENFDLTHTLEMLIGLGAFVDCSVAHEMPCPNRGSACGG